MSHPDSLEQEIATHSSILAWRIPQTEKPGGYGPRGRTESDMTEPYYYFLLLGYILVERKNQQISKNRLYKVGAKEKIK